MKRSGSRKTSVVLTGDRHFDMKIRMSELLGVLLHSLWEELHSQALFVSQGFAGHKEAQDSQEAQWNQPRIYHRHQCSSTSRYQSPLAG